MEMPELAGAEGVVLGGGLAAGLLLGLLFSGWDSCCGCSGLSVTVLLLLPLLLSQLLPLERLEDSGGKGEDKEAEREDEEEDEEEEEAEAEAEAEAGMEAEAEADGTAEPSSDAESVCADDEDTSATMSAALITHAMDPLMVTIRS
jgi:hypothetical protein